MNASPLDVVMAGDGERRKGRAAAVWLAWLVALLLHAVLVVAALRSGPSLEAWSAALALEVHEALVDDQVIELATPTPEEPEPTAPAAVPVAPARARPTSPSTTPNATPTPAAPLEAAAVVTQEAAPIDLTGETIVTGHGTPLGGAAVSAHGEAAPAVETTPVGQAAVGREPAKQGPSLTRAVGLDASVWRCDWPREAVAEDIYQQSVVLRVVVRADGQVEAAQLVEDPGHGFGRAALACAKRTPFVPALDARGEPTRAVSPPIVVRFTR